MIIIITDICDYNPVLDNIGSTYTYLLHGIEVDAVFQAGGTRSMTVVEKCQSSFLYSHYCKAQCETRLLLVHYLHLLTEEKMIKDFSLYS